MTPKSRGCPRGAVRRKTGNVNVIATAGIGVVAIAVGVTDQGPPRPGKTRPQRVLVTWKKHAPLRIVLTDLS